MKRLPSAWRFSLRNHGIIFSILIVFAVVFLTTSWVFRSESPLSSILIELGAGIGLFALLFFVEHRVLTRRIEATEARHDESIRSVSQRVDTIERNTRELRVSIDDLSKSTHDILGFDRNIFLSKLNDLEATLEFNNMAYVLQRSRLRNETSARGLRVDLEDHWTRLRFHTDVNTNDNDRSDVNEDGGPGSISISIESFAGHCRGVVDWYSGDPPDEVFAKVAIELQKKGLYLGDRQFDPSVVIRKLIYSLRFAHAARSQGGVSADVIGPLIEIIWPYEYLTMLSSLDRNIGRYEAGMNRPQWLVSDDGIESMHYTYSIESSRVHESDWVLHMSTKAWVDESQFQSAIGVARALFPATEGG